MSSFVDRWGGQLLRNRSFARAPIWLYRHGFGRLLGSRVLMLEHTGRRSGLPRYVCLEVVERPADDIVIVVSGFGDRAQWYQNLRAHPACTVSIGPARAVPATARMLPDDESADVLGRYEQAHPRAWKRLRRTIEQAVGAPVTTLPTVALALSR